MPESESQRMSEAAASERPSRDRPCFQATWKEPYQVECLRERWTGRRMIRAKGKATLAIAPESITVSLNKQTNPLSYWWVLPLYVISVLIGNLILATSSAEVVVVPGGLAWFVILWIINRNWGYTSLVALPGMGKAVCHADRMVVWIELAGASRGQFRAPITNRWVSLRTPGSQRSQWSRMCEDLRKVYGESLQIMGQGKDNKRTLTASPSTPRGSAPVGKRERPTASDGPPASVKLRPSTTVQGQQERATQPQDYEDTDGEGDTAEKVEFKEAVESLMSCRAGFTRQEAEEYVRAEMQAADYGMGIPEDDDEDGGAMTQTEDAEGPEPAPPVGEGADRESPIRSPKARRRVLVVAGVAAGVVVVGIAILLFVWPTPYVYRSHPTRWGDLLRINRITQDVCVLQDGQWVSIHALEVRDAKENAEEARRRKAAEDIRPLSARALASVRFKPLYVRVGLYGDVEFEVHNQTDRSLSEIELDVFVQDKNSEARPMVYPLRAYTFSTPISPGAKFQDRAPLPFGFKFDGNSQQWWATLRAAKWTPGDLLDQIAAEHDQ